MSPSPKVCGIAACRQARPEDADDRGRIVWRDEACTGLTLRLNVQTRSAAFYFVGKVAGRAVRRALGDVEVVTLQEAREAVNRLRFDRTVAAVLTPRPADDEADEAGDPSPPVGEVADAMIAAGFPSRSTAGNFERPSHVSATRAPPAAAKSIRSPSALTPALARVAALNAA